MIALAAAARRRGGTGYSLGLCGMLSGMLGHQLRVSALVACFTGALLL